MDAMFLSLSMQYPLFFFPLVFVILLFFNSLLVFFACSDSLFELGAPWREWLCLHSSQELAALGVPSPESCVSGGFNLGFFFCIALLMNSAACRCEIGSCDL